MNRSVVIDFLPESVRQYRDGYAIVAIDVIRATTTAATAVALGRRCYPVPSIEAALPVAARLNEPLLCGELGGNMPFGFDITNSPFEVAHRADPWRPMILLSSSGTQLIANAADTGGGACYIACLRNWAATVAYLSERHQHIAVIGAGTRGEFREEDQYCCALIAGGLVTQGFVPDGSQTVEVIERWRGQPFDAWKGSKSVDYLTRSNQLRDLDFILAHENDLRAAFAVRHGEIVMLPLAGGNGNVVGRTASGE
ncbi:MAG TPA: 2-phosphosulfolactate phosphatase [Gemmatimonadales bacterium]|nr:2-phosphosulfolactate phosphatase [Gemmatimonadales bacterium]